MYSKRRASGRARKVLIGVAAAALAGTAFAVSTGISSAATSGEDCGGLDQALRNNLSFIADQRANPDALSDARIANRQAVVDLINQRREAAGCTGDVQAEAPATTAPPTDAADAADDNADNSDGAADDAADDAGNADNGADDADNSDDAADDGDNADDAGNSNGAAGEVVCNGSTVTLSGEGGSPAASSGTFPIGTTLRVTNLDNNKSITVEVATTSGSCVLLNNAAFEEVREPGKFLIRRAVIERIS